MTTQHRATLRYTEPLIARAVRLYWRKTIGFGHLVVVSLMAAYLVWRIASGDRGWVLGLIGATVVAGIVLPLMVYVVHYRQSMGKFREMAQPVAEFLAEQDTFTLSSDRGSSTLVWSAVTEVWRSETLWLLLFSKSQFATLPLDDIPAEMQAFILERVKATGGKVAP